MSTFSAWHPDALAVFIGICVSVICVFAASVYRDRSAFVARDKGFFVMEPTIWGRMLAFGYTLGTLCILYAAAHAHNTPREPHNVYWALGVSVALTLGALVILCQHFTQIAFNDEELRIKPPGRTERAFRWRDLEDIGAAFSSDYLKFRGARRIYRPFGKTGLEQLTMRVLLAACPLEGASICPLYDDEILPTLPGSTVLARVVGVDAQYKATPEAPFLGKVVEASSQQIIIAPLEEGRAPLTVSGNLRPFVEIAPRGARNVLRGLGIEPPGGVLPQYLCEWFRRV